jgi:hypothetical protein
MMKIPGSHHSLANPVKMPYRLDITRSYFTNNCNQSQWLFSKFQKFFFNLGNYSFSPQRLHKETVYVKLHQIYVDNWEKRTEFKIKQLHAHLLIHKRTQGRFYNTGQNCTRDSKDGKKVFFIVLLS